MVTSQPLVTAAESPIQLVLRIWQLSLATVTIVIGAGMVARSMLQPSWMSDGCTWITGGRSSEM